MEKQDNNSKANYYFGSKPVLERAEDENEFEGSLTTSTELQNLAFVHEIPSAFWRSIWLDLVAQGTLSVTEPNFELGILEYYTNPTNNQNRKLMQHPIWRETAQSAQQKGWNWNGAKNTNVYDMMGFEDPKAVALLFVSVYSINFVPRFIIQLSEMQQDPAALTHIRTWKDLWDEVTNGSEHDIMKQAFVNNTDGPDTVISFGYGRYQNSRIWIATKGRVCFAITITDD